MLPPSPISFKDPTHKLEVDWYAALSTMESYSAKVLCRKHWLLSYDDACRNHISQANFSQAGRQLHTPIELLFSAWGITECTHTST